MESLPLVKSSAILLILTALGGVAMALIRAQADRPPSWLAMMHGFLAASGLTLLVYAAFSVGLPKLMWTGVILMFAASAYAIVMAWSYRRQLPLSMQSPR